MSLGDLAPASTLLGRSSYASSNIADGALIPLRTAGEENACASGCGVSGPFRARLLRGLAAAALRLATCVSGTLGLVAVPSAYTERNDPEPASWSQISGFDCFMQRPVAD